MRGAAEELTLGKPTRANPSDPSLSKPAKPVRSKEYALAKEEEERAAIQGSARADPLM